MKKVLVLLLISIGSITGVDKLQEKISLGHLTERYLRNHYECNSDKLNKPFVDGAYKGFTPLTLAIQLKRAVAVRLLLEWGVDVNKPDAFGTLPLEFAIDRSWVETIRLLLDSGAILTSQLCIHLPNRQPVFSYLMRYHKFTQDCLNWMLLGATNHYDIISLLKKGANIHFKNKYGVTAIDNAVKRCDSRSVRILYNYGASLSDIQKETLDFINTECFTTRCNLGITGERRCQKTRTFLKCHGVL